MEQNQTTRNVADVAVKLALVSFVALFAFSVGTYVGKQFSDLEYKRAALEGDDSQRMIASLEEQIEPSVSKEEVEALAEEFVRKEKLSRSLSSTSSDEPSTKNETPPETTDGYKKIGSVKKSTGALNDSDQTITTVLTTSSEQTKALDKKSTALTKNEPSKPEDAKASKPSPMKAIQRIAEDKEPTVPVVKKKREPARFLPGPVAQSAAGKYTVQVASYSSEEEAQGHVLKLKDRGWSAFYIGAEVGGRTWYRVSVGLFETPASARSFQTRLNEEASITGTLIQRIVQ